MLFQTIHAFYRDYRKLDSTGPKTNVSVRDKYIYQDTEKQPDKDESEPPPHNP